MEESQKRQLLSLSLPAPVNILGMDKIGQARIESLYHKDDSMTLRLRHKNPDIEKVYEEFYGKPLSELAEKMLHTSYRDRINNI